MSVSNGWLATFYAFNPHMITSTKTLLLRLPIIIISVYNFVSIVNIPFWKVLRLVYNISSIWSFGWITFLCMYYLCERSALTPIDLCDHLDSTTVDRVCTFIIKRHCTFPAPYRPWPFVVVCVSDWFTVLPRKTALIPLRPLADTLFLAYTTFSSTFLVSYYDYLSTQVPVLAHVHDWSAVQTVIRNGPVLLGICVAVADLTRISYCRRNDIVAYLFDIACLAVPLLCSVTIAEPLSIVLLRTTALRCFRCLCQVHYSIDRRISRYCIFAVDTTHWCISTIWFASCIALWLVTNVSTLTSSSTRSASSGLVVLW